MPIETPFSKLAALVVDDSQTQLSTLRGQLSMLGIQKIDVASHPDEAIRLARSGRHQLILCDYNLNQKTDGQQLFEHLRETEALAPDCLFFMVTAENGYASVASASEHKPDAYLLKPITAADVEERLRVGLERRKALLPVTDALARRDLSGALAACDAVLARKDRWSLAALQHKAQVLMQLGRHAEAAALYDAVRQQSPKLAWAQIGLARAHKAAGRLDEAKTLARALIESRDGERNLAAYDLLAEVFEAQGDAQAAQSALRDASIAVPSARRLRLLADAAFRNGDHATALEAMAKVTRLTQGSVTAQVQDVLTQAQATLDGGQAQEALALLDAVAPRLATQPQQEAAAAAVRAQALAALGDADGAARALERARSQTGGGRADFATVALARAEIATGHAAEGLARLEAAVGADHENPRIKQLVGTALRASGHADQTDRIVSGAAAALDKRVSDAKTMFRESRIDEALAAIEAALGEVPDNTGVLLQATQMHCMALRLHRRADPRLIERARGFLSRLDALMPGSDRVAQMQRYFRETLAALSTAPAPGVAVAA